MLSLIAAIRRFELTAINCNERLAEQVEFPTQHDELAAHAANRVAIVLAEVGDRLEVRHQPAA
jgi:hypothetical protein